MTALVKYEAARAALQAAHDVDEVKEIRDKAQAMAAYAQQAKDTQLVEWASEIKVRAERRAGQMLAEMKVNGSRAGDGNPQLSKASTVVPKLEDLGVSKDQSSQWQKVAAIPEDRFEKAVSESRATGVVTTAAVLRAAKPKVAQKASDSPSKPKVIVAGAKLEAIIVQLKEKIERQQEALDEYEELAKSVKAFEDDAQFKEMQVLRIELKSCKRRRDELMAENADLRSEVKRWRKKAEAKK